MFLDVYGPVVVHDVQVPALSIFIRGCYDSAQLRSVCAPKLRPLRDPNRDKVNELRHYTPPSDDAGILRLGRDFIPP